jgi:hypothetical protein
MSEPIGGSQEFGCDACRSVPAPHGTLRATPQRTLYEGPHEGYSLWVCPECQQPFLKQFQEITWLPDGEDHIWLRWMPLTGEELAEIDKLFPTETEDDTHTPLLARYMHRRGRLVRDPTGQFAWSDSPWDAGNLYPPG